MSAYQHAIGACLPITSSLRHFMAQRYSRHEPEGSPETGATDTPFFKSSYCQLVRGQCVCSIRQVLLLVKSNSSGAGGRWTDSPVSRGRLAICASIAQNVLFGADSMGQKSGGSVANCCGPLCPTHLVRARSMTSRKRAFQVQGEAAGGTACGRRGDRLLRNTRITSKHLVRKNN